MSFSDMVTLVNNIGLEILRIEDRTNIRKNNSGKHKKGKQDSYKVLICRCPVCKEGTVTISRERDLERKIKCRCCALVGTKKEDKQKHDWFILTTDIKQASTRLAKANPNYFIREEATSSKNTLSKRVILKCFNLGCDGYISTNRWNRDTPFHAYCRKCADIKKQKRPYERTYNHAKSRTKRRSETRSKNIQWFLTYEEFVSLCRIDNCHYCNCELNRAKFKADEGSTAILLDRKDSNKDYTLDNCVPCCPDCNFTKNERITYDEMVLIMKHRGLCVENKK